MYFGQYLLALNFIGLESVLKEPYYFYATAISRNTFEIFSEGSYLCLDLCIIALNNEDIFRENTGA